MIFVTVGTNETPFDRLVEAADRLSRSEEVVVQRGSSRRMPSASRVVDFLPFDEFVAEVRRARVVVTHAGVGSVIVALSNGVRPIVMPRLARHREAVDDHQLAFAERFSAAGLVTFVTSAEELTAAVAADDVEDRAPVTAAGGLHADLSAYLSACVSVRSAAR